MSVPRQSDAQVARVGIATAVLFCGVSENRTKSCLLLSRDASLFQRQRDCLSTMIVTKYSACNCQKVKMIGLSASKMGVMDSRTEIRALQFQPQ